MKNSKRETLADFGLPEAELIARLKEFNPPENLAGLVAAKVPLFSVHGDNDLVVPHQENTILLKERYESLGGSFTVKIVPGEGHKVGPAFFECQELVDFLLKVAE
jgi:predicted esterase